MCFSQIDKNVIYDRALNANIFGPKKPFKYSFFTNFFLTCLSYYGF